MFVTDFIRTLHMAGYGRGTPGVGDGMTVTVKCPCGQSWTYSRPKNYGGSAFSDKRCPKCSK